MLHCPNCAAELDKTDTAACWNCEASFEGESSFRPLAQPNGPFRPFPRRASQPIQKDARAVGPMNPFAATLLRAVLAAVVWLVLGAIAVLSVLPYGGTSVWVTLFGILSIAILPWTLAPLLGLFARRPKPSEEARDDA